MIDTARLKKEQFGLAKKVVLKDDFSSLKTLAGCDVAYTEDKLICVIAVCDAETMQLREYKYTIDDIRFPYIPGYLSYREAPPIVETYHKLELDPDVMIIDGNGILHPRMVGLASHVGLLTDKCTIGVTKKLLCGEQRSDIIFLDGRQVGKVLSTKDKAKDIYVSPGHKVSFDSAVGIAQKSLREHKLPEPLHLAHKLATKLKRKMNGKEDTGGDD